MTAPASLHWLLEPHLSLMKHLRPLGEPEVAAGITLVPVTPQRVATFITCENSVHERQVGPALEEHLGRFGAALAAMAIADESAVGCVRARLFHEYDPTLGTMLIAFLGVIPSCRNRGIGSHLVGHLARSFLACPRVRTVAAEVASANDRSLRAFAASGFEPVGHREDKVILCLNRSVECP